MVPPSAPGSAAEPEVLRLSPTGRAVRLAASAVVVALLLLGTVWGGDDAFPFGPFRMYATRNSPDGPVVSTLVVGLTAAGGEVVLSGGEVGLRRAEFEGQLPRIQEHPELLGELARAYTDRHPTAPTLARMEVIQHRVQLTGGEPTGRPSDRVVVQLTLGGRP